MVSLVPIPSIYGKGLSFPMRLDATGTRPAIVEDEQLIKESIDQIINTGTRERPLLRKNGHPFGTRCKDVLFESLSSAISVIRYDVERALTVWEPRIIVEKVDAGEYDTGQESGIIAVVHFRYRASNRSDNFVAPFKVRQ